MRIETKITRVSGALAIAGSLLWLALPAAADSVGGPKTVRHGAPNGKPAPGTLSPLPKVPPFAKAQYDSLMSVNDRCPVRRGHLNPGIRPMYVNRQPVGFC